MEQAGQLRVDVDNNFNSINYAFEDISHLYNKGVVEDHFYVNEPDYMIEREFCFEPITVKVGYTFDISADFTTEVGDRDQATYFNVWVEANGEWVA